MLCCRDSSDSCGCCLHINILWIFDWFRAAFTFSWIANTNTSKGPSIKFIKLRLKQLLKLLLLFLICKLCFNFRFIETFTHHWGHLGKHNRFLRRLARRFSCWKWRHLVATTTSITGSIYWIMIPGVAITIITICCNIPAPITAYLIKMSRTFSWYLQGL